MNFVRLFRSCRRAVPSRPRHRPFLEPLESRALPATISGLVYHDANGNGLFDAGEAGLGGVAMELRRPDQTVVANATTNADGLYRFSTDRTISTAETTQTHVVSVPPTVTDWSQQLNVPQFNPALGTLRAVEIVSRASISTMQIRVENQSPTPSTSTVTVAGQLTLSGPGVVVTLSPEANTGSFVLPAFDGTLDFAGPSSRTFDPVVATTDNRDQPTRLTAASSLASYTGRGTVAFEAIGRSTINATSTGSLNLNIAPQAAASIEVIYRYIPNNDLRPGDYLIVQPRQPAGYFDGPESIGRTRLESPIGNDVIAVTLGAADLTDNNFAEHLPVSVTGAVYSDRNDNGRRDSGEPGLADVAIRLTGSSAFGAVVRETLTNANGVYAFTGLPPGTYAVAQVQQPSGFFDGRESLGNRGGTLANDSFTGIVLISGQTAAGYDFGELEPGSLSGFVTVDRNNNGVRDPGEEGLAGVSLSLSGTTVAGTVTRTTTTDAAGRYSFGNLPPGTYAVAQAQPAGFLDGLTVAGPAGGAVTSNLITNIPLPPGAALEGYNFFELISSRTSGVVLPFVGQLSYPQATFTAPNATLLSKANFLTNPDPQTVDRTTLTALVFVDSLYTALLGRHADSAGLSTFVPMLLTGTPRSVIVQAIYNSVEHRGVQVEFLYQRYLRRAADPAGKQFFVNLLLAGHSEQDLARLFLTSAEYHSRYADNAAFLRGLYGDVLGRQPSAAELQAWQQTLAAGLTRQQAVDAFVNSAEALRLQVDLSYRRFLGRNLEPAAAAFWVASLQSNQLSLASIDLAILGSEEYFGRARAAV